MALRRERFPTLRVPPPIARDETRRFCMQTAVRATVSLRQPAHVIKFPDDDDGDGDDSDEAAFYIRQNGKLQYARNRREPAILNARARPRREMPVTVA